MIDDDHNVFHRPFAPVSTNAIGDERCRRNMARGLPSSPPQNYYIAAKAAESKPSGCDSDNDNVLADCSLLFCTNLLCVRSSFFL